MATVSFVLTAGTLAVHWLAVLTDQRSTSTGTDSQFSGRPNHDPTSIHCRPRSSGAGIVHPAHGLYDGGGGTQRISSIRSRDDAPRPSTRMKPILAMMFKDLRLLVRDRAGFVVTIVFPLVYAVFFGVIFKGVKSPDVPSPPSGSLILPDNRYALSFPLGIMWGVLGCTATFGLSLVVERTHGTLRRLRIAPISRGQILAGKAGACLLTSFCLGAALFGVARVLFDVSPRSLTALFFALTSVSIAFVGLMMLLSVFGTTEQAASGITWTVLLAMAMIGGAMVPRFFMPLWLQRVGDISPVRWGLYAMEGAVWHDLGSGGMAKSCAILVATGLTFFACGAYAFRWTQREP